MPLFWISRGMSVSLFPSNRFKQCYSTRQVIGSSQAKDDEDVYSRLGNKSAVEIFWRKDGSTDKEHAVCKQCCYKIKDLENVTNLARHLQVACCSCSGNINQLSALFQLCYAEKMCIQAEIQTCCWEMPWHKPTVSQRQVQIIHLLSYE